MKQVKLVYILPAILLALLLICNGAINSHAVAFAASSEYSNVVQDLYSDKSFDVTKYPAKEKDYSISVIQIAESSDGELFIYTYQPSGQSGSLRASSINIGRSENNTVNLDFPNYALEYLNSSGVFYKYKVKDFELNTSVLRYYNISNILRPWDKYLDGAASSGNTIQEVPNTVGQLWEAVTVNGEVSYSMTTSEVVSVENKFVGFVNYADGVKVGWGITNNATSAHFVAFDTNRPIEKLMQADVEFCLAGVNYKICSNLSHINHTYGEVYNYSKEEPEKYIDETTGKPYITLDYKQKINKGQYQWDRIQTTSEFLADSKNKDYTLTAEGAGGIIGTKWVLNFYETEIKYQNLNGMWLPLINPFTYPFVGDIAYHYTEVSEIMVLRLEFETAGEHYNLGVVDNKQTGNKKPVGVVGANDNIPWYIWLIVAVVVVLFITILLCVFIPNFGGFLITIFKGAITGVGWLISRPFKAINTKRKREEAAATLDKSKRKKKRKKRTTRRRKK